MANELCFCGEELNEAGECWQGTVTGGHQGNCVICGTNALLDGMRCCSAECDQVADERCAEGDQEAELALVRCQACCERCGEPICPHGFCLCNEKDDVATCPDCARRRQDELDCEREARFQRDVIGPLLGFTE